MTAIKEEFTIPGKIAQHRPTPAWALNSPAAPALGDRQLYLHQAKAIDLIGKNQNIVVSTGTASGKSLIFQFPTIHRLATEKERTAIAIYPIKALARDQMQTWKIMFQDCGIDPEGVQRIDGDTPIKERDGLLDKARIALMTPDIIQSWLLNYSDSNTKTKSTSVNQLKQTIHRFLINLDVLILDEAHTYDGVMGTNSMYLFHRLQYRRKRLNPDQTPLHIFGASATIANPAEHLKTLTGQEFQEIKEQDNGSPKSPLTVQHVIGKAAHQGGITDLTDTIKEIIAEDSPNTYIAFIDDRQLVEKAAGQIEEAQGWTEQETIDKSQKSMSYRAGLMHREKIEAALRDGEIRGITATSAMEMGIDIPDLSVGLNLGVPQSIKRARQRAGRVGRKEPGRFIIVADEYAFQYHDNLRSYWEQPAEEARIYTENPVLRHIHARCLVKENDGNVDQNLSEDPAMSWPEGFKEEIASIKRGEEHSSEFETESIKYPHTHNIRDGAEKPVRIELITAQGKQILTNQTTRREALKEAYPLANYRHAKRSYSITGWKEIEGKDEQLTLISAEFGLSIDTRPIHESEARINLPEAPQVGIGGIYYTKPQDTAVTERIIGCQLRTSTDSEWITTMYEEVDIDPVINEIRTTATTLIIDEEWFDDPDTRKEVARAINQAMSSMEGIHETELRTTWENIRLDHDDQTIEDPRAIVLWDRVGGGLGIASNIKANLTRYTEKLQQIGRDPTGRDEQSKPLEEIVADRLHQWAVKASQKENPI